MEAARMSSAQAVNEIALIAPDDVSNAAYELNKYVKDHFEMAYNGKQGIYLPDEKMNELVSIVYVKMRKELNP